MCLLGNRLLAKELDDNCTKAEGSPLWNQFCQYQEELIEGVAALGTNLTTQVIKCDSYFESHNVSVVQGIRGLASGVFLGRNIKIVHIYLTIRSFSHLI